MKKILLYTIILLATTIASAQEGTHSSPLTKATGDSLYMGGDYKAAAAIYEELLTTGEASDLYYNLANAYYKSNDIARAILNYERALLLAPGDEDVKFNLTLARSKTVDKVSEPYEIFLTVWMRNIANILSMQAWAITAVTAFVILLASILLFLFSKNITIKKSVFFVAIFALFVTIFVNISAHSHYEKQTNRRAAIITQPSVTAKSTPDASGTDLFVIHEGRKATITDDTMKGWKEIELEDGTKGWVPASALEKI